MIYQFLPLFTYHSLNTGTVAVYAPPTTPKARDQLYHIVWDDGDEQDFDELELKAGLALLESKL